MEEIQEIPQSIQAQPDNGKSGLSMTTKVGIGAGVVLGVVLLVLILIFLLNHPDTTETVRDLFIIVLALETLVIGTLIVILILQLIALIRMLRDDLKPMIASTQEAVHTVKGTATFVSQRVTRPAIAASSYASGIARSIGVLLQMLPRRRSNPSSTIEQEAQ
jgi:hypothetical protein